MKTMRAYLGDKEYILYVYIGKRDLWCDGKIRARVSKGKRIAAIIVITLRKMY